MFYRIGTLQKWSVTGSDRECSWIAGGRCAIARCVGCAIVRLRDVGSWLNSHTAFAFLCVQAEEADEGLTTAAAAAYFWLEDDGCGGREERE